MTLPNTKITTEQTGPMEWTIRLVIDDLQNRTPSEGLSETTDIASRLLAAAASEGIRLSEARSGQVTALTPVLTAMQSLVQSDGPAPISPPGSDPNSKEWNHPEIWIS